MRRTGAMSPRSRAMTCSLSSFVKWTRAPHSEQRNVAEASAGPCMFMIFSLQRAHVAPCAGVAASSSGPRLRAARERDVAVTVHGKKRTAAVHPYGRTTPRHPRRRFPVREAGRPTRGILPLHAHAAPSLAFPCLPLCPKPSPDALAIDFLHGAPLSWLRNSRDAAEAAFRPIVGLIRRPRVGPLR